MGDFCCFIPFLSEIIFTQHPLTQKIGENRDFGNLLYNLKNSAFFLNYLLHFGEIRGILYWYNCFLSKALKKLAGMTVSVLAEKDGHWLGAVLYLLYGISLLSWILSRWVRYPRECRCFYAGIWVVPRSFRLVPVYVGGGCFYFAPLFQICILIFLR